MTSRRATPYSCARATFPKSVLWFEHDLYDQLQLLQVMTALEDLRIEPERCALVQSDHYLGMMTTDELLRLLPRRRSATPATFKSARRAWERFTSSSPADLFAATAKTQSDCRSSRLPCGVYLKNIPAPVTGCRGRNAKLSRQSAKDRRRMKTSFSRASARGSRLSGRRSVFKDFRRPS